jgi:hypothetical protein
VNVRWNVNKIRWTLTKLVILLHRTLACTKRNRGMDSAYLPLGEESLENIKFLPVRSEITEWIVPTRLSVKNHSKI